MKTKGRSPNHRTTAQHAKKRDNLPDRGMKRLEAELRYRTLFEQSPDGILIIDKLGNIVDFNEATHLQLGYSREEFSRLSIADIDPFQSPEEIRASISDVLNKGRAEFEVTHRTKGGELRDVWVITQVMSLAGEVFFHTIWRDITVAKKAEAALRESEKRYKNLFDSTLDGVYHLDADGNFTLMNRSGAKILGYETPEEIIGRSVLDFWRDPKDRDAYLGELMAKKFLSAYPVRAKTKDGEPIELETSVTIIEDDNGNILGIDGILRDVSERRRMEEQLRALSITDELTGLHNRRGFFTLAGQQVKISDRSEKGMVLVSVYMDNLMEINDSLGHGEGDLALIEVASVLKESFRGSDIIARIGGDEFAVLQTGALPTTQEVLTKRLEKNLSIRNAAKDRKYMLSISVGVSYYDPHSPRSLEELLLEADQAMYAQKKLRKTS